MTKTEDTGERILIVDDEETLCEALRFNLEMAGYRADVAHSAEEALALDLRRYSLILLDIMMGEISGTQMARILKGNPETASIPIIFCTALGGEDDMVRGLDLGADDYIAKPYSLKNILARVRSVLRRSQRAATGQDGEANASHTGRDHVHGQEGDNARRREHVLECGGLVVDLDRKECRIDGETVRMPRKELEILSMLLQHRGQIFSRETIISRVWPEEVVVLDRVVDVNITRLRSKLGPYGKMIVTRSGYGYGFME